MKKILIIVLSFIIIILGLLYFIKKPEKELINDEIMYQDIYYKYSVDDNPISCLVFHDHNQFFEYDCDSEPTSLIYTGDMCEKYYYDKDNNKMIIKCNEYSPVKEIEFNIIKWNKDEFSFKYKLDKNNEVEMNYYAYEKDIVEE